MLGQFEEPIDMADASCHGMFPLASELACVPDDTVFVRLGMCCSSKALRVA